MEIYLGKVIYIVGIMLFVLIRITFILRKKKNRISIDRKTIIDILMLILIFCAAIIIPLCYIFSPFLNFANYYLPFWSTWLGLIIFIFSLLIFWKSRADLGRNWYVSLEIKKNHILVTD